MNLLMCKSSQLNVRRICKWIAIFDCYLLNVRIANFATISFRAFMCRPCYLSTNFSKVDIFLQKASQNDVDASICITKFGPFYLSDIPLFSLKFYTHQRCSCFGRLFNSDFFAIVVNTFAVDEQAKLFGQLTISELSIC